MPTCRSLRACVTIALLLSVAGCADLKDTPAQSLAYQRWSVCQARAENTLLERVEPDGRIWFRFVQIDGRDRVVSCLQAQSQGGLALPTPVAVVSSRS